VSAGNAARVLSLSLSDQIKILGVQREASDLKAAGCDPNMRPETIRKNALNDGYAD
jgi:hypothetical protein